MIVDYIDTHKQEYGVESICRVLTAHGCKIAPSTYYDACERRGERTLPRPPPAPTASTGSTSPATTAGPCGQYPPARSAQRGRRNAYSTAPASRIGHATHV
ncbi:hypothetical protein GCM10023094_39960 [Rhodococcus olei]|uniref:Helix-turn-helix protein n=1 Tax=Rhodococcus olei TaxID=2161675 RepID=A0ABP8PEU3_9NOCA